MNLKFQNLFLQKLILSKPKIERNYGFLMMNQSEL